MATKKAAAPKAATTKKAAAPKAPAKEKNSPPAAADNTKKNTPPAPAAALPPPQTPEEKASEKIAAKLERKEQERTADLPPLKDIELPHAKVMREENLTRKDLPAQFNKMFSDFGLQAARYEKHPSKGTLDGVKRMSIRLGDAIQTWLENKDDAPGAAAADTDEKNKNEAPATPESKTKKPANVPTLNGSFSPEEREKLKSNGKIYHDDLKKIVKQKSLPDKFIFDGIEFERSVANYYPVTKL